MSPDQETTGWQQHRQSARMIVPLLVTLLLPALYISFRVRLFNLSLDPAELGIITQLQWLSLLFEILKDSILALVVFHLGAVHHDPARFEARWINALWVAAATYGLLAVLVVVFDTSLLRLFAYSGLPTEYAANYLRLEALSQLPMALLAVMQAAFLVLGRTRWLYAIALVQLLFASLVDSIAIPLAGNAQGQSLGWVAISAGTAAALTVAAALLLMRKAGFVPWQWPATDGMGRWLLHSLPAALESTMRNLVFAWMILRLVNQSGQSSLFWNTNHFIWTWMLLPVFALGMLVRRDAAIATSPSLLNPRTYLAGLAACALVWLGGSYLWPDWIGLIMRYDNHQAAAALASSQIAFYLVFGIGHLLTQHFLGKGRTGILLLNSAIVNLGYYGLAFLAFQAGLWEADLTNIVRLFGWGLVAGTIILAIQYVWLQQRITVNYIHRMPPAGIHQLPDDHGCCRFQ